MKKNVTFNWTEQCQKAYETLKNKLIEPPILQYPDFDKPFILTTDASNYALGAVLSQGEIGNDLPISYASKSLAKHDINKPVIEKELLAIHWGINFFRPYLYGRKFIVVTDHRPLVSLFTHKNPSSKLTRIRVDLSDYDFTIVYKKGSMNTNADALSRIELDSDSLKAMVPPEIDINAKRKLLAITRGMAKNQKDNKPEVCNKGTHTKIESDQLYCWDCTSLSDITGVTKLKFILRSENNKNHENDKINIVRTNKMVVVHYSDKSDEKSVSINDKRPMENNTRYGTNNEKNSDNPHSKYVLIMEKLLKFAKHNNIYELSLSDKDVIFKSIDKQIFKRIFNKLQQKESTRTKLKIIIYKPPTIITNANEQTKLIEEYHNSPHGGHLGIRKTLLKLKQRYCWKNMNNMIKSHIRNCTACQINKQVRHTKEKMIKTDTPSTSFETVQIDTVGPLKISNGYRYILTLQCELTKFVVAFPIENKEANTIALGIINEFILKYGHFKTLKSDLGTEFTNKLMSDICALLKIKQIFSTPYHHQTLGTVERNHRVLNEYMCSFADDNQWDKWVPYYTFAYNTTPNIDTNYTPYELIFGKLPCLPNDILEDNNPVYNLDNYANELKVRLKMSITKARKIIENVKIKRTNKQNYINPLNIKIGDQVLVKNESRKKHQPPYKGPYTVVEVDKCNTLIDISGNLKSIHKDRLKLYNKI